MNILFITLIKINSLEDRGIYDELLKKFDEEGHSIHVVSPNERRERKKTELIINNGLQLLKVKTFNIQKSNLFEKGLGTLAIEYQYLFAIKKYFKNVKFDLVLYSTPPITFTKVINFIKKRDKACSYLLLKDIFPQNAVDMGFIKKNGFLHKFFQKKERQLYEVSDYIGCLSKANIDYLKNHNLYLDFNKVEINPNTISPKYISYSSSEKEYIKLKYNIPLGKKIFIYGGNLGKPQGVEFLLDTILMCKRSDVYFLIIGSGTKFNLIKNWFNNVNPQNATLLSFLPKNDYDKLLAACDVGLVFLHKDFTIPNYPSRLLSYLEMKMPVIAATDSNTDVGSDIEKNKCGYWVLSGDSLGMKNTIDNLMNDDQLFADMKENAWTFLLNEFTSDKSFRLIKEKIEK
jgi:glycosyltransferase involved in cell wall biosynthesis